MTDTDSTPGATRYLIEHLRTVTELGRRPATDLIVAWVLVGTIEIEKTYPHYRDGFAAWVGEQTEEAPLGAYRVVTHQTYGSSFMEFELIETREREIRRVERPEPVTEQVAEDIAVLSKAALTPVENTQS